MTSRECLKALVETRLSLRDSECLMITKALDQLCSIRTICVAVREKQTVYLVDDLQICKTATDKQALGSHGQLHMYSVTCTMSHVQGSSNKRMPCTPCSKQFQMPSTCCNSACSSVSETAHNSMHRSELKHFLLYCAVALAAHSI